MRCDLGGAGDGRAEALEEEAAGHGDSSVRRHTQYPVRSQQHGAARRKNEELILGYCGCYQLLWCISYWFCWWWWFWQPLRGP